MREGPKIEKSRMEKKFALFVWCIAWSTINYPKMLVKFKWGYFNSGLNCIFLVVHIVGLGFESIISPDFVK